MDSLETHFSKEELSAEDKVDMDRFDEADCKASPDSGCDHCQRLNVPDGK